MPFPVAKLGYLVIKQISKPTANAIKQRAKTSPFLRNSILIPGAQFYHRLETGFRLRLLGMGKAKAVKPLDEEMAMELGADMLGEVVVFTVGALIIYSEYRRQARSAEKKEDSQNDRITELESKLEDIELIMATQTTRLQELTRLIYALPPNRKTDLPDKIVDSKTGTKLIVQSS